VTVFAEKIRSVAGGRAGLSSREPNEAGGEGGDARSAMTIVPHEFWRVMSGMRGCSILSNTSQRGSR
jgi:hypothetical protein